MLKFKLRKLDVSRFGCIIFLCRDVSIQKNLTWNLYSVGTLLASLWNRIPSTEGREVYWYAVLLYSSLT